MSLIIYNAYKPKCRCCLEEIEFLEDQFPLKSIIEDGKTITDLIESLINCKIKTEMHLPMNVCHICLEKLLTAYEVKAKILESNRALNGIVEESDQIEENTENPEPLEEPKKEEEIDEGSTSYYEFEEPPSDDDKESDEEITTSSSENELESSLDKNPGTETNEKQPRAKENVRSDGKKTIIRFRVVKKKAPKAILPSGYDCEVCSIKMYTHWAYHTHCQKHRKNGDKAPYNCSNCGRKYYNIHIYTAHQTKSCLMNSFCYFCGTKMQNVKSLFSHLNDVHRTADKNDFVCNFEGCSSDGTQKRYTNTFSMQHHLQSHYDPFNEVCPVCSELFTDHRLYRIHVSRAHGEKKTVICDTCGSQLSKKHFLKHYKQVHLNHRVYCEQCFQGFSIRFNLNQHKLSQHQRETSFKCSYCYLRFPDEKKCQQHEQNHASWGGKRSKKF